MLRLITQTDWEAFLEWWKDEKECGLCPGDVSIRHCGVIIFPKTHVIKNGCKVEEWFDNEDGLMRVRFASLLKLFNAIHNKASLTDCWGNIVQVQALLMMSCIWPNWPYLSLKALFCMNPLPIFKWRQLPRTKTIAVKKSSRDSKVGLFLCQVKEEEKGESCGGVLSIAPDSLFHETSLEWA